VYEVKACYLRGELVSKVLLVEVNASKGKNMIKTKEVKEKTNAKKYLYKYLQKYESSRRQSYKVATL